MGYFLHRPDGYDRFDLDRTLTIMERNGARRVARDVFDPTFESTVSAVTVMELAESSFDVVESARSIMIHNSEALSDSVAQLIFELMVDQRLVFHPELTESVLVPSEDAVPDDPYFTDSKVVHSWQELKQIANYEDEEGFF
ncbi:hypothetical protein GOARA_087_00010 [Gordonia araii NBRC 100433]|uniref:Uncharacterized protein n=1 Tax=Gordonia araii NBRC 100433 TaxID=1073574 RepID=G7H783_9ACTN|nr:hypothetical protein [Gordonia araii]NNG99042.1 hypothetical protein [Gordonia araii NBRC 100433]GAB11708.1 hypothetical protein GOARA_087_00010 [Gordonia araii NBRC 100433]